MIATDFLNTASLLKNRGEECHIRTSISRSYYGLFLYFREFLATGEIRKKDKRLVHSFVRQCLLRCEVKEAKKISRKLADLFGRRSRADYDLAKRFSTADSSDCLKIATSTINYFENTIPRAEKEAMLLDAKNYAKKEGLI